VPSAAQKEKMAPMPNFATAIITMTHGRFTPQTGAVPIYRGGALLGALGASGGTGEQDQVHVRQGRLCRRVQHQRLARASLPRRVH